MEVDYHGYRMLVPESETWSDHEVAKVLLTAYEKYRERNAKRKGVWMRSGVKGQVHNVFSKAERAFIDVEAGELPDPDHLEDLIIYSAFALILGDHKTCSAIADWSDEKRLKGEWAW